VHAITKSTTAGFLTVGSLTAAFRAAIEMLRDCGKGQAIMQSLQPIHAVTSAIAFSAMASP
jgi:hypothetical protein